MHSERLLKGLEKNGKLFVASMNLKKTYDTVGRRGLWDVWKMYGVGGHLPKGMWSFYWDESASVCMNR